MQALLLAVMDVWLERTDAIGAPAARKLSAAAMAAALTLPVPAIVQRLDLMVSHVTSVCYEVRDRRRSPCVSLHSHSPTCTRTRTSTSPGMSDPTRGKRAWRAG